MLGYGVYLLTVFCGFCNKIFFEKQQYQDNLKPVSIGVTSTYTKNLRSNFVPTICIFAVLVCLGPGLQARLTIYFPRQLKSI